MLPPDDRRVRDDRRERPGDQYVRECTPFAYAAQPEDAAGRGAEALESDEHEVKNGGSAREHVGRAPHAAQRLAEGPAAERLQVVDERERLHEAADDQVGDRQRDHIDEEVARQVAQASILKDGN